MRRLGIGFHSATPINANGSSYGSRTMAGIFTNVTPKSEYLFQLNNRLWSS
jgi:hypothetical protein